MKQRSWLVGLHVAVLGLIVGLAPLFPFISTWGGTAIGPLLVWKSLPEILLLALSLFTLWLCLLEPEIPRRLWRRWPNRLILIYMAVNTMWAIASPAGTIAVLAGLAMNLRFLALFVVAQIIVAAGGSWAERLRRWAPKFVVGAAVVLAVLAIVQVAWLPHDFLALFGYGPDTISPYILVDQNPQALRAFATLRGPNDLGAFLLLPICLVVAWLAADRPRGLPWVFLFALLVALGLTGSRSAWLGLLVALAVMAASFVPRAKLVRWLKRGAVPALFMAGIVVWAAINIPVLRLALLHSSPGDSSLFEGSTDAHWQAAFRGVAVALAHPLGQGVGTSGPASYYGTAPNIPENYFVQVAQEVGLLGVGLFAAICGLMARNLWRRRQAILPRALLASLAGLTLINILLHGWSDGAVAYTWWALAGLIYKQEGKV